MNILYVFAHPNPSSFNAMLKQHATAVFAELNAAVKFSNLYADNFKAQADWHDFTIDAVDNNGQYFLAQQQAYQHQQLTLDINAELAKIAWADHIIFQFPLWWFSVPAILKGWLDRILIKGFAYDSGKVFAQGLLKGKTASLTVSTQSPESAYQVTSLHQATIDTFLHHIHHTLHFVGIKTIVPFVTYAAFNIEAQRERQIIKDYRDYLKKLVETYVCLV